MSLQGRPPRLLVSVRNAREARTAIAGGADVVDVKEPARGPLGMADAATIGEVVAACQTAVPTSAALGELAEWDDLRTTPDLRPCPRFLKLGLAGTPPDWEPRLLEVRRRFPTDVSWVAVAYADWRTAAAPEPAAVVEYAISSGCAAVLFDTFDKRNGSLLDHLSLDELAEHVQTVRSAGLTVALAGRVDRASLPAVLALEPDIVAIRSAACRGGDRESEVCADAIREFRTALVDSSRDRNASRAIAG